MGKPTVAQAILLLMDHEYCLDMRTKAICRCGYVQPRDPERGWSNQEWHREHLAREIVADLFEPQTVSSAEELDALPVGSVVLDEDGDAWQKHGFDVGDLWAKWGRRRFTDNQIARLIPATVISRPESE